MIDPISSLIHRRAGGHGPAMLMYHAITPGRKTPSWPWAVSLQRFRDHLDFLVRQGYSTPTMAQLIADPHRWTKRAVVITFDDGYVNNLAACEELHRRGMRASWFIVSGSIGVEPRWGADGRPDGRLLNAGELREMRTAGMEIGSHGVSHVRLTELDDDRLQRELVDSRSLLQDLSGSAVTSFAYPYGAWDARCAEAVEQAGYAGACTTRTGWAMRDRNVYQIRRLTMLNTDTASSLARKLHYASNAVSWNALTRRMLERVQVKLGQH